ncbi:glycosyltransferase family 2 protein [Dysgonomonas sp. 520]|uniref:glycosyltransferase family 2 protein n=1 Tax=Dysgonomonas sp. 520 TaxID=2302931 RepID=UPI0013D71C91|nr:glycosyltransferase family 2 protein [Dysgonomonas sp. 520]NDW09802.1 glycosyltransferase family 2 protein [Dysgonomonas sp. 520]
MMISVILPNYNHAQYLKRRIDSILNQSYTDFELIILDDKSSDNSRDVIEEYRNNPHVTHIVYNEVNSGSTFKQWKKGLELAKGDYIWIAESDDWAEPYMIEKLLSAFDGDTVVSFCQSLRAWSDNDVLPSESYNFQYTRYDGVEFIKKRMLCYNAIDNASMALFRKECVDPAWFDDISEMKYCGDWFFWVRLAEKGKVVEFSEAFNYFRQHSQKVTSRAKRLGLDFTEGVTVLKYIESDVKIKIPKNVLSYWARVWANSWRFFDKGVVLRTLCVLVSFKTIFLYYIPVSLVRNRYSRLIKKKNR